MNGNKRRTLEQMEVTLVFDRPVNADNIVMGAYMLNGKAFDFNENRGDILEDNSKVRFTVSDLDKDFMNEYAEDEERATYTITETDIRRGVFDEFNIYIELPDDTEPSVKIEDLSFSFDDGTVLRPRNDSNLTKSANENLCLEFEQVEEDIEK